MVDLGRILCTCDVCKTAKLFHWRLETGPRIHGLPLNYLSADGSPCYLQINGRLGCRLFSLLGCCRLGCRLFSLLGCCRLGNRFVDGLLGCRLGSLLRSLLINDHSCAATCKGEVNCNQRTQDDNKVQFLFHSDTLLTLVIYRFMFHFLLKHKSSLFATSEFGCRAVWV